MREIYAYLKISLEKKEGRSEMKFFYFFVVVLLLLQLQLQVQETTDTQKRRQTLYIFHFNKEPRYHFADSSTPPCQHTKGLAHSPYKIQMPPKNWVKREVYIPLKWSENHESC